MTRLVDPRGSIECSADEANGFLGKRTTKLPAILTLCGLSFLALLTSAASYPDRPIRFIVPFAPGGGNDIIARAVGQKLSEIWGQQVVVDNRAGAGGNIGAEIAARSAPNGYTIFLMNSANLIAPSLFSKLAYDPIRDFSPVTEMVSSPFLIVVRAEMPVRTVKDLVALARSKPSTVTFASGGSGSSTHLVAALFALRAGIQLVHIPYKGAGPALVDLLGGQVNLYFSSLPPALPYLKSGRLRSLAITSLKRSKLLPEMPTVEEAGVPNYDADVSYGVVAPADTPAEVVRKLYSEISRILNRPEFRESMESQGTDVVANSPADYGRVIRTEVSKWAEIVKISGVKAD